MVAPRYSGEFDFLGWLFEDAVVNLAYLESATEVRAEGPDGPAPAASGPLD